MFAAGRKPQRPGGQIKEGAIHAEIQAAEFRLTAAIECAAQRSDDGLGVDKPGATRGERAPRDGEGRHERVQCGAVRALGGIAELAFFDGVGLEVGGLGAGVQDGTFPIPPLRHATTQARQRAHRLRAHIDLARAKLRQRDAGQHDVGRGARDTRRAVGIRGSGCVVESRAEGIVGIAGRDKNIVVRGAIDARRLALVVRVSAIVGEVREKREVLVELVVERHVEIVAPRGRNEETKIIHVHVIFADGRADGAVRRGRLDRPGRGPGGGRHKKEHACRRELSRRHPGGTRAGHRIGGGHGPALEAAEEAAVGAQIDGEIGG